MKKKLAAAAAACALAGAMAIGSTFAYLTDRQSATNTFTVGSVKIKLEEPAFKEESAKKIVPNQVIAKNPTVTNTGDNPALVFAKVSIPKETVITEEQAAAGGASAAAATQELFTFLDGNNGQIWKDSDNSNPVTHNNWILLKKDTSAPDQDTYLFGYSTAVAPKKTTETLFDSVRYLNVVEGQVSKDLEIPVQAYAIQADNVEGVTIDEGKTLSPDTLKSVYSSYLGSRGTFSGTSEAAAGASTTSG